MSDADIMGGIIRRMVHDIANPLGAAQMLAEDGDPLLQQSIARVADLLALYRAIFGGNPADAIDSAALWRRLAAAIEPATLTLERAAEPPPATLKAAAALVLATAGRGPVRLKIGEDCTIHLTAERPRPQPDEAALAFAQRLAGPLKRRGEEPLELRSGG